jgi:N-acetylglucosaminyl-diphospho-decaprenol L-rhamnosyltransferase
MPRCSVIVVTYNSAAAIADCLHALASQDCEILVVDNASQDETVERVRSLAQELRLQLITVSRNVGFAGGANHGASASSGDVLLFLNPDTIAEPGALDALLTCIGATRASAVGGALLADDGQPERGFAFRRLPTLSSLMFEALLINQIWPSNPVNRRYRCLDADYSHEQQVEQPAGACLAVTRETWDSLQGMDAGFYPVWFEDVDFCARLLASGRTIFYCPDARFHHSGAHSVGQLKFGDRQMFWYRNMTRYAGKHFGSLQVVALRLSIFIGMGLRMVSSLLSAGPEGVSIRDSISSYARVGLYAMGLDSGPGAQRVK